MMVFQQKDNPKYQLKFTTKRLKSGNYQVKFKLDAQNNNGFYGYLLASPGTSVANIVGRVRELAHNKKNWGSPCQSKLHGLQTSNMRKDHVVVFNI